MSINFIKLENFLILDQNCKLNRLVMPDFGPRFDYSKSPICEQVENASAW